MRSYKDPDDMELLDKLIDEVILDDCNLQFVSSSSSNKSIITLFVLVNMLERMKERKLIPNSFKRVEDSTYPIEIEAIQFTGDCMQEQILYQWLDTRRIYFCYDTSLKKDSFFMPGTPSSVTAKPGDWICKSKADGVFAISNDRFLKNYEVVDVDR